MSAINDGGPAFPQGHPEMCKDGQSVTETQGMTLRDWFAGQVLGSLYQALIKEAEEDDHDTPAQNTISLVVDNTDTGLDSYFHQSAEAAYAIADAMIAQRGKEETA